MASVEPPSEPATQTPPERILSEVFNSSAADLALRSSDGVDFRIHRSVLAIASTVFEGMCSLPQPKVADEKQELPVVQMGEDSHTLTKLLMLLYPDKHPSHIDVKTLPDILRAAEKYDMHGVVAQLGNFLRRADYLQEHPVAVFAIACQYNFGDDLVELAARASLLKASPLKELVPLPPAARGLSAGAYHSLLVYRQNCTNILRGMLLEWPPYLNITMAKPVWHTCICRHRTNNGKYNPPLPGWYADHVERVMAAFSEVVDASTIRSPDLIATTTYQFSPLAAGTASAAPGVARGRGKPASSCACAESAPYELVKFHAVIADKVECQLSQMEFKLLG